MVGKPERIVHVTTVATNALLEREGAKVALLTTASHRGVIEMRERLEGTAII
ncbi:hydantoinase/oxoprolinase N-terminal domain-containing protein [Tardiphaga sp. 215_C5_N2_1]|uniref:hydantoinase/oxoprolinase N-terminal domain-containing protein n=1 Tax=Tardiphaga sp. 215_C5_N2_1 TaxID=3240774 RepID=UPI003F89ED03